MATRNVLPFRGTYTTVASILSLREGNVLLKRWGTGEEHRGFGVFSVFSIFAVTLSRQVANKDERIRFSKNSRILQHDSDGYVERVKAFRQAEMLK